MARCHRSGGRRALLRRLDARGSEEAHRPPYPPVEITAEMAKERPDLKPLVGQKLTVIAWLWARINPAFSHVDVPLASNFNLSTREGKEAYVQPVVSGANYRFTVKVGSPPTDVQKGTKAPGRGANFRCLVSDVGISGDYIKSQGQAGRMGARLMAVIAEGARGRVYLSPTGEMDEVAQSARPTWKASGDIPARLTGGTCVPYGLKDWGDIFTSRQSEALATFSDLVGGCAYAAARLHPHCLGLELYRGRCGGDASGAR